MLKSSTHNHFLQLLILMILGFCPILRAQVPTVPDSILKQQLTRSVYLWQDGHAKEAYATLDSVLQQPLSQQNVSSLSRASLRTALFLVSQYKVSPALPFIDSAFKWSNQFHLGEELRRSMDAYAQWYSATGNNKKALEFQQLSFHVQDSLKELAHTATYDSLKQQIAQLAQDTIQLRKAVNETQSDNGNSIGLYQKLIAVCVFLILILSLLLLRKKNTQQIVVSSGPIERSVEPSPKPVIEKPQIPTPSATPSAPAPVTTGKNSITDLTARLSAVELVLIRPDVFAWKMNGDTRATKQLLVEYLQVLPGFTKKLDDAIAANNTAGVLDVLKELQPLLENFGMSGTIVWIKEVEAEAATSKLNKLLSRVFQVRNHCRRAADEAKSLLETADL